MFVHWLDIARHALAGAFSWYAVSPNIGAGFYWAALVSIGTYLVWPKLHKAVDEWMKRHAHAANAELHAKLDHIIKHHPDIPPMSTKRAAPTTLAAQKKPVQRRTGAS